MTMTAKIIAITQVKGGSGRSTLATNLAGELSKLAPTTLVDADLPQATAQSWYVVRQQAGLDADLMNRLKLRTSTDYLSLLSVCEEASKDSEYVVLDCPPRMAKITRAALMLADLVLIPCGPSKAELWATLDILDLIKEAEQTKPIRARLVWTRYRSNTRLSHELEEMTAKEMQIKALKTKLGLRVGYQVALGDGLTATEVGDPQAKAELLELTREVIKQLKK